MAADTIHNNLYTALSRMTLLDKIGWINNSKYVVYISVVVYTIQSLSYLPQQALEMRDMLTYTRPTGDDNFAIFPRPRLYM